MHSFPIPPVVVIIIIIIIIIIIKVKNDHRSRFFNLTNWKEEAWKKSRLQPDSNPWPPRYRCDALPAELWRHTLVARSIYLLLLVRIPLKPWFFQAFTFQLLKLEHLMRWSFFTLIYNRSSNIWIISYILHIISLLTGEWPQYIDLARNVWLHSSVGRASHRYRGGHGFESRWSLDFFRLLLSNCLNWKIYCDDHSSLWTTTAVQIYELFHIYFTSIIIIIISINVNMLISRLIN